MFKPGDKVRHKNTLDVEVMTVIAAPVRSKKNRFYDGTEVWVDSYGGSWLRADQIEKVVDDMKDPNVITLNGKQYVVETIPGKGECLVPYTPPQPPTLAELKGKVVRRSQFSDLRLVVVHESNAYLVSLTDNKNPIRATFNKTDRSAELTVVADSLSDAIQKGLIK